MNVTNSADGALDADGDGILTRQEYLAGTDPTDPQSYLRVETFLQTDSNVWKLRFFAVSNRTYTVEGCPRLGSDHWLREADVLAALTNRLVEIIRPAGDKAAQRYFRLVTPSTP